MSKRQKLQANYRLTLNHVVDVKKTVLDRLNLNLVANVKTTILDNLNANYTVAYARDYI